MAKTKTKTKRPSMRDVAELAGVSRTTVSFIMNNKSEADNIPERTKEKVWAAVESLNYRPNALARGLRSQRSHTIGFISDEIATTPFSVKILLGAQDLAWEHNKPLLVFNTGSKPGIKEKAVDILLDQQVDGIIYSCMYHREAHPPPAIRQVPTVLVDCFVADGSFPSVIPDEERGGFEATQYLIEAGHQCIGFINNRDPIPATTGRLKGYQRALESNNIPFNPDYVLSGTTDAVVGYHHTLELMQLKPRPTALFCFNDQMAIGAYDALRKLNLSIPGDVAVIGFDNQEIIAPHLYPGLTTMELPHYEMGQWGIEHLLQMIDNPQLRQEPVHMMLPCPLIERDSV